MSRSKSRRISSQPARVGTQPAPAKMLLAAEAEAANTSMPRSLPGNQSSLTNGEPPEVLAFQPGAYQITLHRSADRKHDDLIVTFAGQPGDMSAFGFGTTFVLGQGFDTIYVSQEHETHYQKLSREKFAEAIGQIAKGRRVVFYGSSLGAYAALYYAGTLNAEVIAAAPMLPSAPLLNNPRYKDFPIVHGPIEAAQISDRRVTILFDPHRKTDRHFLDEAIRPGYPAADYVELPYAGHTVLRSLAFAKQLGPLIVPLLKNEPRPEISLPTEGFSPYHLNKGNECLQKGDLVEGERHARAAFAVDRHPMMISFMVRALVKTHKREELATFVTQELDRASAEHCVVSVPSLKQMIDKEFPGLLAEVGLS